MSGPVVIDADTQLWNASRAWPAAVDRLHERFQRSRPLPDAVMDRRAAETVDVAADIDALTAWAGEDIDLGRELRRFFDEYMPMFVRPNGGRNRELRELSATSELQFTSALPTEAAEAALRHAGVLRFGTVRP